eukprot:TRINITY_DN26048_c0_g1_i1.p1 TRINITY_DN26048_c0_g1~~TRINITY_DN26048_c0_g1_i1.p1  ORF type:complete len:534 (-),score=63.42 TRINITY_DN26048_c0_g1_i1:93-1694(-)
MPKPLAAPTPAAVEILAERRTSFDTLLEQLRVAHDEEIRALRACLTGEKVAPSSWSLNQKDSTQCVPTIEPAQTDALEGVKENQSDIGGEDPFDTASFCGDEEQPDASNVDPIGTNMSGSTRSLSRKPSRRSGLAHIRNHKNHKHDLAEFLTPLGKFVTSKEFEAVFCALIFINSLVIAIEVQYHGLQVGFEVGAPGYIYTSSESWPWALITFDIASWIFGVAFTVEILLKMIGLRTHFVKEVWNWIDLTIVVFWIIGRTEGISLPINSQVFRLARLARLMRLLRIVRKIQGFDSLFLMTTAISGSVSVLFWTLVLMSMVQMMLALFLNQYLHEFYFHNESNTEAAAKLFSYFGTFSRCFFTMFELTLANWPPACRLLAENVSEWFLLFGMMHKLFLGFAVVGVVNGVFMQETFKVASMDDILMVRQKERAAKIHREKMTDFLMEADVGEDGFVSKDEFLAILSDPHIAMWLSSMELDPKDGHNLFALLDVSKDGKLSLDELVRGVSSLKGTARSIDLAILTKELRYLLPSEE